MFSIKNIINSDTTQVPEQIAPKFSFDTKAIRVKYSCLDKTTLPDRTLTTKYLGVLKTRLSLAKFKVENEWEDKSFPEILQLHKNKTSNSSFSYSLKGKVAPYITPTTPINTGQKRKHDGDPISHRALTPQRVFNSNANILNSNHLKNGFLVDRADKRHCRGMVSPLLNTKTFSGNAKLEKENINPYSNHSVNYTTPPRQAVLRSTNFLPDSSNQIPPTLTWSTSQSIPNIGKFTNACSSLPTFEAAETIMLLCSPHSSTPGTPQLLALECPSIHGSSTSSRLHTSDQNNQSVFTSPTTTGPYISVSPCLSE
ncbi:hypothetical protein K7432_005172 [Basidiobolus ranarum]|uniref:Uncharacterized protein n=1 Tax=Basidiobolus ranarum TaxID=34480 RepID=A0ABR2W3W9_9FUNG